jgi:surface carbohydrate biosynthesis protein
VFTSSTLGYESLARGKKTAAIMLDAQLIKADALKFGWPADLADEGKFWTHQLSQQRIYEIMDYLSNTTDDEWNETRLKTIKDVIEFDPGNSKFVSVIDSILAT